MNRSVLLLATHHKFQGPRFCGFVEDPSYKILIEMCVRVRRIDFVFEEAGKRGPSIAEECTNSLLGPGHYLNIEPPGNALRKYGIAEDIETETGHWIDDHDKSLGKYVCQNVDAHKSREVRWLQRIDAQPFEKGLVICGVGHSLSFAFRLQTAGFSAELCTYLP